MDKNITCIINAFPKKRPSLSSAHEACFKHEYKMNREGETGLIGGLALRLEQWMHKKVSQCDFVGDTLEVGAGTLNHLVFEKNEYAYDIVEPFQELYLDKKDESSRIRSFYRSIIDIPGDIKYDRIISIATMEHMTNLPKELELIHEKLTTEGVLQVGIPTEGGILWGLAWRLTTALSYKIRTGLSYSALMRHEHVNTADEILSLVKHYFGNVEVKRFPFNSKHLSFYTYFSATR